MPVIFRLFFHGATQELTTFKKRAPAMTDAEYDQSYEIVSPSLIQRGEEADTDLNEICVQTIQNSIVGNTVLDAGSGRGYLAGLLSKKNNVTGFDLSIPKIARDRYPSVTFIEGRIESLPFPDKSFDTVVCAHTLEHVAYFMKTVAELRRVARQRLIIITPKQRPYLYTFDLHLHFFPYPHSLLIALNEPGVNHRCDIVDGDLFYVQDFTDEQRTDHSA